MTIWFTADTHFGHRKICEYSNRPFSSVDEMDEVLIDNWNSVIQPNDTVYHLGDFAFGSVEYGQNIFNRLKGKKHLIEGNHDKSSVLIKGWESITSLKAVTIDRQHIVMCHYAMRVWNRSHYGAWMLYGHSHGSLPDDPNALSIDVGVDCHGYKPISMLEVAQIMSSKQHKHVDHHGGKL